jgi:hypothetical protein
MSPAFPFTYYFIVLFYFGIRSFLCIALLISFWSWLLCAIFWVVCSSLYTYSSNFLGAVIVHLFVRYLIPAWLCSTGWQESFGILQVFVMYFLFTYACMGLILFVKVVLIESNLLLCSKLEVKCDFGGYVIEITQRHTDIWYSIVINKSSVYLKYLSYDT